MQPAKAEAQAKAWAVTVALVRIFEVCPLAISIFIFQIFNF
jgi:hypothetical protein